MADWYVRPDASHGGTNSGTSYVNAWQGWSAISWGSLVAGDTLYVCGSHLLTVAIAVGSHGGSSSGRVVIRGDYAPDPGSMTVTAAGGVFLSNTRAWTEIRSLTITNKTSNCLFISSSATNCNYIGNIFIGTGTSSPVSLNAGNGQGHQDLLFDGNTFTGVATNASTGMLSWFVSGGGATTSSLTRITISNNTFTNCSVGRSVVHFRIQNDSNAACAMNDIVITGNTWTNCRGLHCEILGGFDTFGTCAGIKVLNNTMSDGTYSSLSNVLGGGFSIWGFKHSLTSGFGPNTVSGNTVQRLVGPGGGFDMFFGSYLIYGNTVDTVSTETIDGNGILFDYGCQRSEAYRNTLTNINGKAGQGNSGCAVMILDSTTCHVYANTAVNCLKGVFFGNQVGHSTGQSATIENNTFINCQEYGVYSITSADKVNTVVRNNVFTCTSGTAPSVFNQGSAWQGESYNCFANFAAASGHSLAASSITPANQAALSLDANHRPASTSPVVSVGTPVALLTDKGNGAYWAPPAMGAYEAKRSRSART